MYIASSYSFTDFRQRVNLTPECWNCLNNDVILFSNNKTTLTLSGLMNRIICNFPETALSAVQYRLNDHRERCLALFKDNKISKRELELLEKVKRGELLSQPFISPKKGIAKNIKLNKEAFEFIKSYEDKSYDSIGTFLHALFEEYALLPSGDREQVIYKDIKDIINDAIELGDMLSIQSKGSTFRIKPYRLINSGKNGHCYLVGLKENGKKGDTPISFRFIRIENIRRLRDEKYTIDKSAQSELGKRIIENDPAFLVADRSELKIRFTQEGISLLSMITNNRPECIETVKNDDGTYDKTFLCCDYQAEAYFKAFGAEAIVISPKRLNNKLKSIYKEAYESYKNT